MGSRYIAFYFAKNEHACMFVCEQIPTTLLHFFSFLLLIINVSAQSKSSCSKPLNCSRLWHFTLKIKVLLVLSEVSLFTWPCMQLPQRGIHNVNVCRSILSWCNMTDRATLVKFFFNLKSLKDNGLKTKKPLLNSNIHGWANFLLSLHFISQMQRLHQIQANTQFAFVPERPSRFGTITDNCACSHDVWYPEPPRRYTGGRQPIRSGHSVFGNNISPCSRASAERAAQVCPQTGQFASLLAFEVYMTKTIVIIAVRGN